jgi:hypothetical protein
VGRAAPKEDAEAHGGVEVGAQVGAVEAEEAEQFGVVVLDPSACEDARVDCTGQDVGELPGIVGS